jgi:catechol 2,3-dioxygenase-like lactoylglutathione lyase family enzyme
MRIMSGPTFSGVHLFVCDMAKALAFYRRLGLSFPADAEKGVFASAKFGRGATLAFGTFALTRGYDPGFREPTGAPTNCLQFDVSTRAEVDLIHKDLVAARYKSHLAPHDAFWGARYAEIEDPDGNLVGLQSPQDPSKSSPPPVT